MADERMTTDTVDICTCGIVMHHLEPDDYDTGGSDSGRCCPNCGNEKFRTVKQILDAISEFEDIGDTLANAIKDMPEGYKLKCYAIKAHDRALLDVRVIPNEQEFKDITASS